MRRDQVKRWNFLWALALAALFAGGCSCSKNYEREARSKLNGFFSKEMAVSEFSINSPWKSTFKPDNIKKRASVDIENVDLLEVRLPGSPNGLEAAFRVAFTANEPFQLKNLQFPAGSYISAGTMKFIETTRGVVIQDADFAILDKDGKLVGANYLPWKSAGQAPLR